MHTIVRMSHICKYTNVLISGIERIYKSKFTYNCKIIVNTILLMENFCENYCSIREFVYTVVRMSHIFKCGKCFFQNKLLTT